MRRLLIVLSVFVLTLTESPAQSPPTSTHKLQFEVASVRESKSDSKPTSNFPLDRGNVYSPTGGVFSATNQSFLTYLIFAYKVNISEFRGGLMRSLPKWALADKFDISARSESPNPTKDDMRLMLQSLLEERFKLQVHREQRQVPIYGLYLVKPGRPGPQLKPHDPNSSCTTPLPSPPPGTPTAAMVGLWPATCGDGIELHSSRYRLREGGRDMTMAAIANHLTGAADLDRAIFDQTGLSGTFDFILEFDPASIGREAASNIPLENSGPTAKDAIKDQLGLQLKPQDGPASFFVVDHVEYPSPN
jgi:uncharacterized protein (TIGR03435 family)